VQRAATWSQQGTKLAGSGGDNTNQGYSVGS
jgi:hypothetical protein